MGPDPADQNLAPSFTGTTSRGLRGDPRSSPRSPGEHAKFLTACPSRILIMGADGSQDRVDLLQRPGPLPALASSSTAAVTQLTPSRGGARPGQGGVSVSISRVADPAGVRAMIFSVPRPASRRSPFFGRCGSKWLLLRSRGVSEYQARPLIEYGASGRPAVEGVSPRRLAAPDQPDSPDARSAPPPALARPSGG